MASDDDVQIAAAHTIPDSNNAGITINAGVDENKEHKNGGEEANGHLCFVAGGGECSRCRQAGPVTPKQIDGPVQSAALDDEMGSVKNDSDGNSSQSQECSECEALSVPGPAQSAVRDGAKDSANASECGQGQAPAKFEPSSVPWREPPGVRSRVLIAIAEQNARSSRFISRNFYLSAAFKRGANPNVTLSVGLTAEDFANDPKIGAGFGPINQALLPINGTAIKDLMPFENEVERFEDWAKSTLLCTLLGEGDEPCAIGRYEVLYTAQELGRIRWWLHSKFPQLHDDRRCKNCGRKHEGYTAVLVCAKCHKAAYCTMDCQFWDWPIHKLLCDRSGDADPIAVQELVQAMATRWQSAMGKMRRAAKSGRDTADRLGVMDTADTVIAQAASPSLMLYSRALTLHLAAGRRVHDFVRNW